MTDSHAELELARQYAARTLRADQAAAFEDHLVGCEECQAEVRLAVGIRRAVGNPAARPIVARRRTRWIVGALAAAALLLVFLPKGADRQIRALGRITNPPAYQGVSVRALPKAGDSLFASAMSAYNQKQWTVASM